MAVRALHILVLGSEDIEGYPLFHLGLASSHQELVAFQADGERLEEGTQSQCIYYLEHLTLGLITSNKDGLDSSAGHHSPFHNLGVFGQYHPALVSSNGYHLGIIAAVKEQGIVPCHSQPPGQLTHIGIDNEFWTIYYSSPCLR